MNFPQLKKVPISIHPNTIAEAVAELRFDSDMPSEVILGIIFNKFKDRFPNFNKLPILELPSFVRENDPNLKFSPQYRMENSDFIFQIGPKCFSLTCSKKYAGWEKYYAEIIWVFEQIKKLEIIRTPLRLGLRYINFFENLNIFEQIQMELCLAQNPLANNLNVLRSEFISDDFRCIYQISNSTSFEEKNGSSLDIDVICENQNELMSDFEKIISSAHNKEKTLFFGILNEDFLLSLNPVYD